MLNMLRFNRGPLPDLQQQTGEILFSDLSSRPHPHDMAALIQRGATDNEILAAARQRGWLEPVMDVAQHDLLERLPYYHQINDRLAAQYGRDATLLFAGRDAELLYDDMAVAHPEATSFLLPASIPLWSSKGMGDDKLARPFLASFGITERRIRNPDNKYIFIDSGFVGSAGNNLSRRVEALYQVSMRQLGSLAIRLVRADRYQPYGEQIMSFDGVMFDSPRITPLSHISMSGPAWDLAINLQLSPHYHGTYHDLRQTKNHVVAVPRAERITTDLDHLPREAKTLNASLVNPAAAAVFQYHTVRAALARASRRV